MQKPETKGFGSLFLWILAYGFMAADSTERLQVVAQLVLEPLLLYLPIIYGSLGVGALILLKSAHKDDIDSLRTASPENHNTGGTGAAMETRVCAPNRDSFCWSEVPDAEAPRPDPIPEPGSIPGPWLEARGEACVVLLVITGPGPMEGSHHRRSLCALA